MPDQTPRSWSAGDPEPPNVTSVIDRFGNKPWVKGSLGGWTADRADGPFPISWANMLNCYGPLVEVQPETGAAPVQRGEDGTNPPIPAPEVAEPAQDGTDALSASPQQPPGIDPDGYDLPDPIEAAVRVGQFLEDFGDGRIDGCDAPYGIVPPLYARDLQALHNAVYAAPGLRMNLDNAVRERDALHARLDAAGSVPVDPETTQPARGVRCCIGPFADGTHTQNCRDRCQDCGGDETGPRRCRCRDTGPAGATQDGDQT